MRAYAGRQDVMASVCGARARVCRNRFHMVDKSRGLQHTLLLCAQSLVDSNVCASVAANQRETLLVGISNYKNVTTMGATQRSGYGKFVVKIFCFSVFLAPYERTIGN